MLRNKLRELNHSPLKSLMNRVEMRQRVQEAQKTLLDVINQGIPFTNQTEPFTNLVKDEMRKLVDRIGKDLKVNLDKEIRLIEKKLVKEIERVTKIQVSKIPVIQGRDGTNGRNGIDGANGKDGEDGKDGRDGIDGKSAVLPDNLLTKKELERVEKTLTRKDEQLENKINLFEGRMEALRLNQRSVKKGGGGGSTVRSDDLTSQVNGSATTFTSSYRIGIPIALICSQFPTILRPSTDYTSSGTTITMNAAIPTIASGQTLIFIYTDGT